MEKEYLKKEEFNQYKYDMELKLKDIKNEVEINLPHKIKNTVRDALVEIKQDFNSKENDELKNTIEIMRKESHFWRNALIGIITGIGMLWAAVLFGR